MWKSVAVVCLLCVITFVTGAVAVSVVDDIDVMPAVPVVSHVTHGVEYIPPVKNMYTYTDELEDSIIRSDRVEGWDCVDYSLDFVDNNPEWMVLSISRSRNFCPESHMINCIIYDNETLIVYDGFNDVMYRIGGWQWDHIDYYHFWVDGEQIVRNYRRLPDNRVAVI